jgi:hypothetical protein
MNRVLAMAAMAGIWTASPSMLAGQSSAPTVAVLNVPAGTCIVARLMTNLDAAQNHVGDPIQAEVTRDVKEGKQTVIERGSVISGKIVMDRPYHERMTRIGIIFDQVTAKDGQQLSTRLRLRALAPVPDLQPSDSLKDGRGNDRINMAATTRGGLNAASGSIGELGPTSQGVYGIPGLTLAFEEDHDRLISLITSDGANLRLKSGFQAVFEVSAQ